LALVAFFAVAAFAVTTLVVLFGAFFALGAAFVALVAALAAFVSGALAFAVVVFAFAFGFCLDAAFGFRFATIYESH